MMRHVLESEHKGYVRVGFSIGWCVHELDQLHARVGMKDPKYSGVEAKRVGCDGRQAQ